MYLTLKAIHVIAIISWMAGLLYLPRLFIYHVSAKKGSDKSETFKVMEKKLMRIIMNPAMIISWLLGLYLAFGIPVVDMKTDMWFHIKLLLVIGLTVSHMMMAGFRKKFENDANEKSEKYFRIFNEVPTVLMILIVLLVVIKPF